MVTLSVNFSSLLGVVSSVVGAALIVAQCVGTCTCSFDGSGMIVCVSFDTSCGGPLGTVDGAVSVRKCGIVFNFSYCTVLH